LGARILAMSGWEKLAKDPMFVGGDHGGDSEDMRI
jgi:hypothetical protein